MLIPISTPILTPTDSHELQEITTSESSKSEHKVEYPVSVTLDNPHKDATMSIIRPLPMITTMPAKQTSMLHQTAELSIPDVPV